MRPSQADMDTTHDLAEALSRAAQAVAAAEHAQRWARTALQQHISRTGACHICDGRGWVKFDQLVPCCDGHLCGCGGIPVWDQVNEPCPYGCDPAPVEYSPDDFCF